MNFYSEFLPLPSPTQFIIYRMMSLTKWKNFLLR